jgi:hypothetical protein
MTKEMKGPFTVQAMGGPVMYTGWNVPAVKYALKQAVGTVVLTTKNAAQTLTVGQALQLAGAL